MRIREENLKTGSIRYYWPSMKERGFTLLTNRQGEAVKWIPTPKSPITWRGKRYVKEG